ncbi:hypothetical protein NDU88_007671 [Pleurodeles waltl]|uniref:Uncharacterized protein n=1 Tax=Pleurodeles waltl TaxID=8319 RepID=A0AAV7QMI8_PLEWA|nr:hypothetical protein NDU88_007671 [Pleurodeles waltl]
MLRHHLDFACDRWEAGSYENDDSLLNPGPQEPFPGGTIKRVTSVRIEERADVRTQEKRDACKWSQDEEKGGDWRNKDRGDRVDRSKKQTYGGPSSEESGSRDPRNEEKVKGNPWRRDKGSRTGENHRPTVPGRNAEARHFPGRVWLSQELGGHWYIPVMKERHNT